MANKENKNKRRKEEIALRSKTARGRNQTPPSEESADAVAKKPLREQEQTATRRNTSKKGGSTKAKKRSHKKHKDSLITKGVDKIERLPIPVAILSVILVGIIALSIIISPIILWKNYQISQSDTKGTGVVPADGAILYGQGNKNKVDLYIDFHCPVCKRLDSEMVPAVKKIAEQKNIEFRLHPMAFLNNYSGGERYSSRTANAALCVATYNPDRLERFTSRLFDMLPALSSSGTPTNKKLASLARDVYAGKKAEQCINNEELADTVASSTELKATQLKRSVPVVFINGKMLTGFSDYNSLYNGIMKEINTLS